MPDNIPERPTEDKVLREVANNEVTKALDRLDPKKALIVEKMVLDGKTPTEIAIELKMSDSGVTNLFKRSIRELQLKLKPHEKDLSED